ncbi:MAG: DUF5723 family protein [Prevotella sp.]|nr:DUF5723 family protein [Prevotella sp.]
MDLGVRTHMDANIPKSFFGLLKKGFQQDAQTPYDLSDLSATGYSFAELGVSHSRPFMDNNLMLGVRVKLLGGFADFNLEAQSLSIEAGPELWRAKSKVSLRGSAPGVTPKYNENGNFDGFDFDGFGMPGYGAGLDIGAVYQLKDIVPVLEGLKVSAALNDIGFIAWNKNNSVNLHSPETVVEVRPSQYENQNGSSLSDVLDNAFEDIKEAVNLKEDGRSGRTTALRMNMNLGAEYEIFKNKLSVGALYSKRFGNYFTTSEFIASVNARLCPWISTSLSYGVVHSKFDTFGLAIHLAPTKGLNLFIASDYAIPRVSSDFIPTTSKGVNAQFGISIPIGGKKSRAKETLTADDIEIKTFDKEIDVETKSIKEEIMSSDE